MILSYGYRRVVSIDWNNKLLKERPRNVCLMLLCNAMPLLSVVLIYDCFGRYGTLFFNYNNDVTNRCILFGFLSSNSEALTNVVTYFGCNAVMGFAQMGQLQPFVRWEIRLENVAKEVARV